MAHAPQLPYTTIKTDGDCSLRKYDALVIAQMPVRGERKTALDLAFRGLFRYIGGNNQAKRKIPMTAPVIQQPDGVDSWLVDFVMPAGLQITDLPAPLDSQIKLAERPARLYGAHQFSGIASERRLNNHREALEDWLQREGYKLTGPSVYAFYDPPYTLPFRRRNEILTAIEVDPNAGTRMIFDPL